ncbi:MAG TPA: glutathione S-transferase family protein [Kofleriaceae bacterium]|nr:glutathione S-transferase family protein [Kofleriaceae bacterium]
MSLELISHPVCPYAHRAAAMLTEKGVPFRTRHVDLTAKPDWFKAISPRGKVPVLRVDDVSLVESLVILEFIDERFPPRALPDEPLERARLRMWSELSNDLMAGLYTIMTAPTPLARQSAVARTRDVLVRFEQVVVGPWFDGADLTLVDFAAGPALLRLQRLDRWLELELFAGLPRVTAWTEAIVRRPAFADTLVPDFDERLRGMVVDHAAAA